VKRRQFLITVDIPYGVPVLEVYRYLSEAITLHGVIEPESAIRPPIHFEDWEKIIRLDYVKMADMKEVK
jgi:hypothetical protein